MSESAITGVEFALTPVIPGKERPLLVLGPSLGTSVVTLWQHCVPLLTPDIDVIGWELPGHGGSTSPELALGATYSMAELAEGVSEVVRTAQRFRGDEGAPYFYAGVSVAGAVGQQLATTNPSALAGLAVICSAAKFGESGSWLDRAATVEQAGVGTQLVSSAERWFATGFARRHPERLAHMMSVLKDVNRFGYAAVCRAIADFDGCGALADIMAPTLIVAGAQDTALPLASSREVAAGVGSSLMRLRELEECGHQAPIEQPAALVEELVRFFWPEMASRTGLRVRSEVLGADHVQRAFADASSLTGEFQNFITEYAWGKIWGSDVLEFKTRSAITLTSLIAGGHWDEFAMHVRAARRLGWTWSEVQAILMQSAIYLSVPSANHAFRIADQVRRELGED